MNYRSLFVGLDTQVPLLNGKKATYINLDNAASTPALLAVERAVNEFLRMYSSVHRGTGFKSQVSTHSFEEARQSVLRFVGGNSKDHVCIFGKNTTEAVNKLARRFPFTSERDTVLISSLEHHSNDLPWRGVANVVHVGVTEDGWFDEKDFLKKLDQYASRLALVSISGASNVTGLLQPIHWMAEKTHAMGAQICVDCAQLAPHRSVDMLSLDNPAHLDYVTISAHKMYAPFGTGALIARRDTFEVGDPDYRGGGEVDIVTLDSVVWSEPPERDEAGSPNTVGAIALAAAIAQFEVIGMDAVARHEAELTEYSLRLLNNVPGIRIYGDRDPGRASERLGVIPFNLDGLSHFLVAAILGYEFGIGVRNGCFCAHPYILNLLGVKETQAARVREDILAHNRSEVPGMIRMSFGLYNTFEEIDAMVSALKQIQSGSYQGVYVQDSPSGEFHPEGWNIHYPDYFSVEKFAIK